MKVGVDSVTTTGLTFVVICCVVLITLRGTPNLVNCSIANVEFNGIPIDTICCMVGIAVGGIPLVIKSWTVFNGNWRIGSMLDIGIGVTELTIVWILFIVVWFTPILFNSFNAIGEFNGIPIDVSCCIVFIAVGGKPFEIICWRTYLGNSFGTGKLVTGIGIALFAICIKFASDFWGTPALRSSLIASGDEIFILFDVNFCIVVIAVTGKPTFIILDNTSIGISTGILIVGFVLSIIISGKTDIIIWFDFVDK